MKNKSPLKSVRLKWEPIDKSKNTTLYTESTVGRRISEEELSKRNRDSNSLLVP